MYESNGIAAIPVYEYPPSRPIVVVFISVVSFSSSSNMSPANLFLFKLYLTKCAGVDICINWFNNGASAMLPNIWNLAPNFVSCISSHIMLNIISSNAALIKKFELSYSSIFFC